MANFFGRLTLRSAEQWSILATVAFLPALEAPKNISVFCFVIFWIAHAVRSRNWGGPVSRWDFAALGMIGAAYASAAFGAYVPAKGMWAAADVLTFSVVFVLVRRRNYDDQFFCRLLITSVAATLVTLVDSYWQLYVSKAKVLLELKSVGHVNHSAIYIAIMYCAALVFFTSLSRSVKIFKLAGFATIALYLTLFFSQARGAIIPSVLFTLAWIFLFCKAKKIDLKKPALFVLVAMVAGIVLSPEIVKKTSGNIVGGYAGSYRPALAKVGLLAVREYPFFGLGITNFAEANRERVEQWQTQRSEVFKPDTVFFSGHAHGLYFNTLAERGLVGFFALLFFLCMTGLALMKSRPLTIDSSNQYASTRWGAAAGAWCLAVVGGLFNTTLHHEHALITMIFLGLWLSKLESSKQIG